MRLAAVLGLFQLSALLLNGLFFVNPRRGAERTSWRRVVLAACGSGAKIDVLATKEQRSHDLKKHTFIRSIAPYEG